MREEILLIVHARGELSSDLLFPEEDAKSKSVEESAFLLQCEHTNLGLVELTLGDSLVLILFQRIENVLEVVL